MSVESSKTLTVSLNAGESPLRYGRLNLERKQALQDKRVVMATSPARPRGGRLHLRALILAAGLFVPPALAHAAGPADLYYERTVMWAADGRCRLFTPEIGAALAASSLQARGAALRSGVDVHDLDAAARGAAGAIAKISCAGPELAIAADRVRKAFAGYARIGAMTFQGELGTWLADRNPVAPVVNGKPVEGPRWRLSQAGRWEGAGSGPVRFGLAGASAAPAVADGAPGGASASSAFLILRDPAKAGEPYIDPRRHDLAGRAPPADITRTLIADAREAAPASLLPGGRGMLFAFPAAAAHALEALDPREVVVVEFVYPDRPSQRALFEVGDFAAGRAFLSAGR
jgi:hypothetical protein